MLRWIIAALFTFIFTAAVAGDFEDGVVAYKRKDYVSALAKFRSAALQGDPAAQYNLGQMYRRGDGVAQDYKEAVRWYRLAAHQGYRDAQFNLGLMYNNGQGVAQDYKEAVRWYQQAAQQGLAQAQYNLGRLYFLGQGALQDYVRAHMWFNIAAISGDKDSVKNRDVAAGVMSAQQIEQAQRMARECMASNFAKCD